MVWDCNFSNTCIGTAMAITKLLVVFAFLCELPSSISSRGPSLRLSKPLIGDDGRVYACSEYYFFAFENNGSIAWSVHLDFKCNVHMAPIHGGPGKVFMVAENTVVEITFPNTETSEATAEVFLGHQEGVEITGVSMSTLSSTLFINLKNRGLFAFKSDGRLRWSVGPVLYQFGYRQGCRKNLTDCYFTSVPVLDQCEASLYMSNTEGELYCLSIRSRYFRWIQDFSYLDKVFTITPGNNGFLYVTIPLKALVLALDVFSGNVLWQRSVGPLSKADTAPVVDSNGWVSIGSLDGFLYSFSPTGSLKKFSRRNAENAVIQVDPLLDCSGYAIYISQTEMEGKISHTIDEYTHVSAIRPKSALFTLLVPATGSISWSVSYLGQFSSVLQNSDLNQFVMDEEILLAFLAASKTGNPLQCRTTGQKLISSCSQARTNSVNIYTGNERAIVWFLFVESVILVVLVGVVRFCCTFWSKNNIQHQGLASFLDKRRSLQLQKKAINRTISEVDQKGSEKEMDNKKTRNMVIERESIERKLSTTYSLGRDRTHSQSKSPLPLYKAKKAYSFKNEINVAAVFDTLSDASSSIESGSEGIMEEESSRSVSETRSSSESLVSSSGEEERFTVNSHEEG